MHTRNYFEILKTQSAVSWQRYTQHEFLRQLGKGTLPQEKFQYYLKQDYLFLLHFIRAWGLALYKSEDLSSMHYAKIGIQALLDTEIQMHIQYCQEWGIDEISLSNTPESSACVAYTRYVLDCGMRGSLLELHTALLPCLVGYAESALWLKEQKTTQWENNPYRSWIEMYLSDEYQETVQQAKEQFQKLASELNESQLHKLSLIFETATRMEVAFWDAALDSQ